jgi:ABC-type nitrate/sulfonate/bicarbonate transport system ATPase subunit
MPRGPDSRHLLQVKGLGKGFAGPDGALEVLRDVSLYLNRGEFVCLIGPSGCGKSTLFNVLVGLTAPDRGSIRLGQREVPNLRGLVAYMQQKDLLLPWRNTLDNAILGMEIQGFSRHAARREAMGLLKVFGLEGFEDRRPHELSGGMRQRVALMRTMLCRKEILLLDEPFGALDAITRGVMQRWLLEVWGRFHPSVILVTHDVEEALLLADRIYVMTARPTVVKAEVPILLERPRSATQGDLVQCKAHILSLLEEELAGAAA